ncbi:hypothetical protein [Alicyclobacillus sendaiensis]|uniref:hypothetical protein n=1 Tax=Alicyclobacillus sendaiensis TaxID=192387 RepID=UPI0026F45651|nr:hypothetical protein [Alicyclobacillus sendaiensis]
MWTIVNNSGTSISVNDIPVPQEILPYQTAMFEAADVLTSRTLAENLANGSLCVINFGTFTQGGPFLPVTYPVHPMATETANGASNPFTVGVFSQGLLLLNVTAMASGSSLSIAWEAFDGSVYYPAETEIANVTSTGAQAIPFSQYGVAGRFTWTVTGSVTFSLLLQMR